MEATLEELRALADQISQARPGTEVEIGGLQLYRQGDGTTLFFYEKSAADKAAQLRSLKRFLGRRGTCPRVSLHAQPRGLVRVELSLQS